MSCIASPVPPPFPSAASPQWRRGPPSKPTLCNACGTRYRRTGSLGQPRSANAPAGRAPTAKQAFAAATAPEPTPLDADCDSTAAAAAATGLAPAAADLDLPVRSLVKRSPGKREAYEVVPDAGPTAKKQRRTVVPPVYARDYAYDN